MSTIFSKIIAGEIPCHKVYEDETMLAFLDINPVHKGHTLVIPKQASDNVLTAQDEDLSRLLIVGKRVANAIIAETGCGGVNLLMNCGEVAGQEVFHTHLHIIPRFEGDGLYLPPPHESYQSGEAESLAARIATTIQS